MTEIRTTTPPIEVVTPLKASEAMRLGCLTTRQAFGEFGYDQSACAVGAMSVGYGMPASEAGGEHWAEVAGLHMSDTVCPETGRTGCRSNWAVMVFHLNDDHRWSRERIADWLEGLGL